MAEFVLGCILCRGTGHYTIYEGESNDNPMRYECDHSMRNLDWYQEQALAQVWPGSVPSILLRRQIEHFVLAMDIKGIGPSLIKRLVEDRTLKDAADLYKLTAEDIVRARRKEPKAV